MAANNSTIQEETATMDLEYVEFRITRITLYVAILVLSCFGNSLVAIVIVKARRMRASSNIFILNLALCDFITPALSIPFDLALEERNYIWSFGKAMCKTLWPFQTVFSTSSTLTLAAISLDRFRILVKPFTGHISTGKSAMFLFIIHAFSIGLCIPYFIALDYNESEMSCSESWTSVHYRQTYTIVLFLCQYALPLITMTIAYVLIYHSLHSDLTRLLSVASESRDRRSHSRTSTFSKDSMEFKRKEQNIRLAKMFVIVVVVFAISMFPNQVLWLWVDFGNGADHKYFHYISVVCRICTYANSVLNPFIYALKSREFRSGFARIGRTTVMQPLRKISSETRKYVRKVSRNVLDSERPTLIHKRPSICRVDTSDDLETFDVSPTELSPLPGAKIRFTFKRKPPVPRRKFSCYEMGDVKELCVKSDFSSVAPSQNGSVMRYNGQEGNDKVLCEGVNGIAFLHDRPPENSNSINVGKSILEIPFSGSSYRFFAELRETDC